MEEVVASRNVKAALKRVRRNRGSPGIDRMKEDDLPKHLMENLSCCTSTNRTAGCGPSCPVVWRGGDKTTARHPLCRFGVLWLNPVLSSAVDKE